MLIDIIYTVIHMPQLELPQSCIIFSSNNPFNVFIFSLNYVTLNSYGCLRLRVLHLLLRYVTLNCRNFIVSVVAAVVRSNILPNILSPTTIYLPSPT